MLHLQPHSVIHTNNGEKGPLGSISKGKYEMGSDRRFATDWLLGTIEHGDDKN
jgi:hypothetical protein